MRRALTRKLRSQRGASLLLALLFLLICSMAAASILMAAASNAGKHRSNLAEHQTYLALSSAVSLLCDELSAAEYRGQYRYEEETIPQYDGDVWVGDITYRYLVQMDGEYTSDLAPLLLANLDALFAGDIKDAAGFTTVTTLPDNVPMTHTLTVKPQTGTELDDRPVAVTLTVRESYAMYLTAELDGYQIQAELTPVSSIRPALLPNLSVTSTYLTEPVLWKIGWITTQNEEETP